MRLILTLALLLMASTAWAGPEFLAMINAVPDPHTSINGISAISTYGITDTGTETKTGTGIVTVAATCEGTDEGANVNLVINGATVDSVTCTPGGGVLSDTLAYSVSGTYSVRVYGTNGLASTFSAGSFYFP